MPKPSTFGPVVGAYLSIYQMVRKHWRLIFFLAKREITDAFAGSYLGRIWSIAHPLIQMAVLVAVFAIIFRGTVPGPELNPLGLDFSIHMISAYLPWMALAAVLVGGCSAVSGQSYLAKQVVFPLEVLPVKLVLAHLLPQLIGSIFLIGYTAIVFHELSWMWLLWPVVLFFQVCLLVGITYLVASIGVFVRDLREVTTVLVLIGFYLSPILFSVFKLPSENPTVQTWFTFVMYANPVSYLVWPFRDIAFHGYIAHPAAWVVLPIASLGILGFGYSLFHRLKPFFGNAL